MGALMERKQDKHENREESVEPEIHDNRLDSFHTRSYGASKEKFQKSL